jgi:AcrR family transcriptional regulator
MVLRPYSADYLDMLTDAALHIVRDHGMAGLTVSAVADWLGVTRAAVAQKTSRDRMVADVVETYCLRWSEWVRIRSRDQGAFALLPGTDEDVAAVRIWLALAEQARNDACVAQRMSAVAGEERDLLKRCAGITDAVSLETVIALVTGLRHASCAPEQPMSAARAREVLAAHLDVAVPDLPALPDPAWSYS